MKIKDILRVINKRTYTINARILGDNLFLFTDSEYLNWFLKVPLKATSWIDVENDWSSLGNAFPADLTLTMNAVRRLIDTPIGERFPEKKWLLCIGKNDCGQKIYLTKFDEALKIETTLNADCLTEWNDQELQDLVDKFPNLAPAIDAMKEPAEGEDE